jgi:hypothetical protein
VASSTLQYRPVRRRQLDHHLHGASSIVTCSWNTAALADGLYDLRTTSTDVAGNTGISPVVANRRLDNIAPTATMTRPAANLTGSVTLASTSADAANGSGVASGPLRVQAQLGLDLGHRVHGLTTPFTCSFDTSTVADGLYDFRAVAIDGVAKTGTVAAVSARAGSTTPRRRRRWGALAPNLAGSVSLASTARRQRQRPSRRSVPVQAHLGLDVDQRLLVVELALLVLVRHHVGERRPLRLPRRGDRQRRPHRHLGRGGLAPHRQHRPDGHDDRARREPHGLGHARLDAQRRQRQRRRLRQYQYKLASGSTWTNACSSRRRRSRARSTPARCRRRLRLPRDSDRQRRPHRHLGRGDRRAASTTPTRR